MKNIKTYLSIASFACAIAIGFIALVIPPIGIIDASVLWFTSQCLVFTSGMLGINFSIDGVKKIAKVEKR